jgi:hypothetical protein
MAAARVASRGNKGASSSKLQSGRPMIGRSIDCLLLCP